MRDRTTLVYGVTGQTIEFYPSEGVPDAAATYKVYEGYESNDNAAEFSGTATADSVDTTVDAASGFSQSNRRRLNLTATTDVEIGRRYWLTNAAGEHELVEVTAISSGAYVDVSADLAYDYAVGATFKGARQSFTIDATFVADESKINGQNEPYRVLWSYAVGSVAKRSWTYFDLVRQRKEHGITHLDLIEMIPDLAEEQPPSQRGQWYEKQIDFAWERVQFDLWKHGVQVAQIRDPQILDELLRGRCRMALAESGYSPGSMSLDLFSENARRDYEGDLLNVKQRVLIDQGREGGITRQPVRPMTFNR